MALPVVLKSGKNYITLVLDSEMDFPTLLQNIVSKFIEAQKFFNHESIALKFDGRKLEEKEKLIILDAIDEYTTITISQIIENDEVMEYAVEKAAFDKLNAKREEKKRIARMAWENDEELPIETVIENNSILVCHDLEPGEKIFGTGSIIVKGNVPSGAMLKAGNSIIVIGSLYGQALAGNDPVAQTPFILARDFYPENFRIGSIIGSIPQKKGRMKKRDKNVYKIARFLEGAISIEDFK